MKTLLERARAVTQVRKTKATITPEHIELCIAWMTGEITFKQISTVLGKPDNGNALYFIATVLKEGYARGAFKLIYPPVK